LFYRSNSILKFNWTLEGAERERRKGCFSYSNTINGSPFRVSKSLLMRIKHEHIKVAPMIPKARGLARHGGPPGLLEESDPARVLFCTWWTVHVAYPAQRGQRLEGWPNMAALLACWWRVTLPWCDFVRDGLSIPMSWPMRPKARGLAQHGGPPGWLEESDPAGCDFLHDGRSMPPALTDYTTCPGLGPIYY
jgi:hypothetical protein